MTTEQEAERIEWRGAELFWRNESWPKFDNSTQEGRPFYAAVSPVGTRWVAEIRCSGGFDASLRSATPQTTPTLALEAARMQLVAKVRELFGSEP